jgi:hypothetical protein
MWADRVRASGVCESIDIQLEMDVIIDVPRSREALVRINNELRCVLHQVYYLDQVLESTEIILREEKRLNLELKVENRRVLEENADLTKVNRRLKQEIDKLVRNGRI